MNYRFNSFYQESLHPFVEAMYVTLNTNANRGSQIPIVSHILGDGTAERLEARKTEMRIAQEIVEDRRKHPSDKKDLLNAMVNGRDPKTGEQMSDALISSNMITFLIAGMLMCSMDDFQNADALQGHETTSSFLTFTFYNLLRYPDAYCAAQEEVDRVVGTGAVEIHHLKGLKYINALMRETIRLYPTVPAFSLKPRSENESHYKLGEYLIPRDVPVMVLVEKLHRDPKVWGEDADVFKPERMLDDKFNALPRNSWKVRAPSVFRRICLTPEQPFGNGARACIGQSFAWQEALLAITILLQRFDFRADDPDYQLKIKFQLTVKPEDFYMRASLRKGLDATALERALSAPSSATAAKAHDSTAKPSKQDERTAGKEDIRVLYGSNTGTCETLAQRLVADAGAHGWNAKVQPLDDCAGNLPTDVPTVIITTSYEGQPTDNAARFVEWLSNLSGSELKGARFAVFGCGHHDWHETFHRIPKLVDETVTTRGGTRLVPIGTVDVANDDVIDEFETWLDGTLWPALISSEGGKDNSARHSLDLEISSSKRTSGLRQDVHHATVVDARRLTAPDEPEKRHLEVQLPKGMTYECGDYLAVLPLNHAATVRRVLQRFDLAFDTAIKVSSASASVFPTGTWIPVNAVLRGYVELTQPASKKDIRHLASLATSGTERTALESLAATDDDDARASTSALDLLERFPSVDLPFAAFLALLPPLRVRLYSISSSPTHAPNRATITYSVLAGSAADAAAPGAPTVTRRATGRGPTNPGVPAGTAIDAPVRPPGVASTHLAALEKGDRLAVAVRPCRSAFRLPSDADASTTPLILVAAGTGLAPFRGFVQERAQQIAAGAELAPAVLFVGCRERGRDALYEEELTEWEAKGAVNVKYAFSRGATGSRETGRVQERVKREAEEVRGLWGNGGKVFICGAGALVRDVGDALKEVLFGAREEDSRAGGRWREAMKEGRVVMDVFG